MGRRSLKRCLRLATSRCDLFVCATWRDGEDNQQIEGFLSASRIGRIVSHRSSVSHSCNVLLQPRGLVGNCVAHPEPASSLARQRPLDIALPGLLLHLFPLRHLHVYCLISPRVCVTVAPLLHTPGCLVQVGAPPAGVPRNAEGDRHLKQGAPHRGREEAEGRLAACLFNNKMSNALTIEAMEKMKAMMSGLARVEQVKSATPTRRWRDPENGRPRRESRARGRHLEGRARGRQTRTARGTGNGQRSEANARSAHLPEQRLEEGGSH